MTLLADALLAQVGGRYRNNNELPPPVRQALRNDQHAMEIWRAAFNAAAADPKYKGDQQTPFQVAWAAVARQYVKGPDGTWRPKTTKAAGGAPPAGLSPTMLAGPAVHPAADSRPATVTLHDVELTAAGSHLAQTGPVTVTTDDLDAMVAAAHDPEIDHAAVRFGHIDPRFDGEPAAGWVENVRRVGNTLLGDLAGVPARLETVVRNAFRRRSAEIGWDVTTPAGRRYRAALTGLALLGVTPPAVKGLADVAARYSGRAQAARTTLLNAPSDRLALERLLAAAGRYPTVSVGGEDSGSHARFAAAPGGSMTDEQIRALFGLAPDAPITDQMRSIAAERAQTPPAPNPEPQRPQPTPTSAPTASNTTAAPQPSPQPQAQSAPQAAQPQPSPSSPPDQSAPQPETSTASPPGQANEPGSGGPAPTPQPVMVDSAALAQLQRDAAVGVEAGRQLAEQRREETLLSAMRAGKFMPTDLNLWRGAYDRDPGGTTTMLGQMAQVVPTTMLGSAADVTAPNVENAEAVHDTWMTGVFGSDEMAQAHKIRGGSNG